MRDLEKFSVPLSIVVAGALVAGAVIFTNNSKSPAVYQADAGFAQQGQPINDTSYKNVKPVSDDDHIFGDKKARVKVIEFSDFECPFCAKFHPDMKRIVEEYKGEVAWVYRHYPLDFHPKAMPAADASECVASRGSNDAFWKFSDKVFEEFTAGRNPDFSAIAVSVGVNKGTFDSCAGKGAFDDKIASHMNDAMNSGFRGTPYSIIVVNGEPKGVIDGAQPYSQIKSLIEQYK